jgi:transcription factor TGA
MLLMYYVFVSTIVQSIGPVEIATTGAGCLDTGQYMYQKGTGFGSSLGNWQSIETWGDSGMADNSQQTDTSTDVDADDKNQVFVHLSLLIRSVFFLNVMICFFLFGLLQ